MLISEILKITYELMNLRTYELKDVRTERLFVHPFLRSSVFQSREGSVLILTLVFIALFVIIAAALASLATSQHKLGRQKVAQERALQIAEAGINYYRWHLAHAPEDYKDGSNGPGPYIHDYNDPYGSKIGEFSLQITPPDECSSLIEIESTGSTVEEPNVTRTIKALYGQPSLAKFAFLTNSNVWFGENEELKGPIHSNGGIRQDGENDSVVTSSKETYICGPEHGCALGGEEKPGVWGEGKLQELWNFPTNSIDFNSITSELSELKIEAQSEGVYLAPTGLGYHLILRNDSTYDLYQVTQLQPSVWGYNGESWVRESNDILSQTFLGNFALPSNCTIIFVEDDLWLEGELDGQHLTIISAVLPDVPETNTKIIINGNITYKERDGSSTLALIAQKDILVPLYSAPDNLEINGVLLAQKGHVFRYYYPNWYSPYHLRSKIELYGAIITNTIWTWSWVNSSGTIISGYEETETIYDPNLKYNPPPGFPTEESFDFIKWEEITL